jgi:prephenate dehydrogenase
MMFKKVTIFGIGLLGASFASALKKYSPGSFITGSGRSLENLQRAKDKNIIDSFDTDTVSACRDSDLVMLATPVGSFIDLAKAISPVLKKGAVLTDVGSVKGRLVRDIEKLMPEGVHYIGGHPIAGSDRSGLDAAHPGLFMGSKCIITPTENSSPAALEKIKALWAALGSRILILTPEEHDRIYASVSHLPHIVAYALVNTVSDIDISYMGFGGKGFIDATRIACSSEELWTDICLLNRENLVEALGIFRMNLDKLARCLESGDADSLKKEFRRARTVRENLG